MYILFCFSLFLSLKYSLLSPFLSHFHECSHRKPSHNRGELTSKIATNAMKLNPIVPKSGGFHGCGLTRLCPVGWWVSWVWIGGLWLVGISGVGCWVVDCGLWPIVWVLIGLWWVVNPWVAMMCWLFVMCCGWPLLMWVGC